MPKTLSSSWKTKVNATGTAEVPFVLLEITHSELAQPVRVINDNQDLVGGPGGNDYIALAFRASLPDDFDKELPRARLRIDNVGKELVGWLELSQGGRGAKVRMMQVLRSAPTFIEWETTFDLTNVQITATEVTGDLGYEDLLSKPASAVFYRPDVAPGLF